MKNHKLPLKKKGDFSHPASPCVFACCPSKLCAFCFFSCRSKGLECEVVSGHAKGFGYRNGDSFHDKESDHAWNAVCTDGKWRLVDSCWGAGHGEDSHHHDGKARFKEHHFAMPPEQFALTHLPQDDRWQLLAVPITMEQFEKAVAPEPQFFKLGISVASHTSSIIHSKSGDVQIKINNPRTALLLAHLHPADDKKEALEGHTLVQTHDGVSTVNVHCPSAGEFVVKLYGRQPPTNRQGGGLSYGFLMSYTILTKAGKPNRHARFPKIFGGFERLPGAYIFSPISGSLARHSKAIKFHLLPSKSRKGQSSGGQEAHPPTAVRE